MNDLRSKSLMSLLREPLIPYAAAASVPIANPAIVSAANAFGQGPPMASFVSIPVSNSVVITEDLHVGALTYPSASVSDGDYVWRVTDDVVALSTATPSFVNYWENSATQTFANSTVTVSFGTGGTTSPDIIASVDKRSFTLSKAGTYQVTVSSSYNSTGSPVTQQILSWFRML